MLRHRLIQLVCVLGTIACLTAGLFLCDPIRTQRRQYELTSGAEAAHIQGQASLVSVTSVALGAFRGLLADVLWIRANKFKDEGKFYDANTLAEWITTLQPSFSAVWVFHAWNMAYNISVVTYTPQERWDWVSKGIRLLRDRGVPLNPRSPALYNQLSYIFFHKIGGYMDDMHWYYKRRLAQEWQTLLGTPGDNADITQATATLRAVVAAPDDLAEFKRTQPDGAALLDQFTRLGYDPDQRLLSQLGLGLMFHQSYDAAILNQAGVRLPQVFDPRLANILGPTGSARGLDPLLAFLRKLTLRDDYHMDPAMMLRLSQPESEGGYGYGPLDWRLPATHALYWARIGVNVTQNAADRQKVDLVNIHRMVIFSIQQLADTGRLNFDPVGGRIDLLPEPRFFAQYEHAVETAKIDLLKHGYQGNPLQTFDAGLENEMLKAVENYYLYGSVAEAQRYYDRIRKDYGGRPDRIASGVYTQTLEDLVLQEVSNNFDTPAYARQFLDAMLIQAFTSGLANNRMDVFDHFMKLAQLAHAKAQARAIVANPNDTQRRMAFLPFDQIVAETYIGLLNLPLQNPSQLLNNARVWRATPLALQARVYARLQPTFAAQCQAMGMDPDVAFPRPQGVSLAPTTAPATQRAPGTELERHY